MPTKFPLVFVFGSNLLGIHGAGAALTAKREWGAKHGEGVGYTGSAYALPTKYTPSYRLSPAELDAYIAHFLDEARRSTMTEFLLTPVGTGLAGFSPHWVTGKFLPALPNIIYPYEWITQMATIETPAPARVHKFYSSSVLGDKGEKIVQATLEGKGFHLTNVAGVKRWQEQDIDFLIAAKPPGSKVEWETIEVKADQYLDNFFIETLSNVELGLMGWLYKSQADVIAYCFTELGLTYWLPREDLLFVMKQNMPLWGHYKKTVLNRDASSGVTDKDDPRYYRKSEGYAIPRVLLTELMKQCGSAIGVSQNAEVKIEKRQVGELATSCLAYNNVLIRRCA